MPYQDDVLRKFESVSTGVLTEEVAGEHAFMGHQVLAGQYLPEVIHLGLIDRPRLVSGWDIDGSLQRVAAVRDRLDKAVDKADVKATVDSTTLVLLDRMNQVARLIGLLTLLIALPLLWMAWVLAANLSGLLMLNYVFSSAAEGCPAWAKPLFQILAALGAIVVVGVLIQNADQISPGAWAFAASSPPHS